MSGNNAGDADHAESGAPSEGEVVADRFSTDEIFQRVLATGSEEVNSSLRILTLNGVGAGFAITFTFVAHAALAGATPGAEITPVDHLLYPVGTRLASVPALLRVWGLVLAANLIGAVAGTAFVTFGSVLDPSAVEAGLTFGEEAVAKSPWSLFSRAVLAGAIVAGMVWLEHAARESVARFMLVYFFMLVIPVTGLYHVVVSTADATFLLLHGVSSVSTVVFEFLLPVLAGNVLGGVGLVTLLNYGQTEEAFPEAMLESPRLSWREWSLRIVTTEPRANETE
ncbi:transporter [Halobacteriales archaeon SW_5_70_135]|nr:MAG: transporter [Halobacteriales archaeon SW_5_70_135]